MGVVDHHRHNPISLATKEIRIRWVWASMEFKEVLEMGVGLWGMVGLV